MKKSAGILLFKKVDDVLYFLLVHPGGPFWKNKDLGSWSIPKGEFTDEAPLAAAIREFYEETGFQVDEPFIELKPVNQKSGKYVYAFATKGNIDTSKIVSNTFLIEWPPKSGMMKEFPEIDAASWFLMDEAMIKIIPAQTAFLLELNDILRQVAQ